MIVPDAMTALLDSAGQFLGLDRKKKGERGHEAVFAQA